MTVTITTTPAGLVVEAPYDATFVDAAHDLSGVFSGPPARTWTFDLRDEQSVRALCRDIYGTDGADDQPTLSVRVPLTARPDRRTAREFRVAGRTLAYRPGRDVDVKLGKGVVLISGGFPGSAGSVSYPELAPYDDTVVEVRDLPPGAAHKIVADVPGATLVDDAAQQRDALIAERSALLARVAQITDTLTATGPGPVLTAQPWALPTRDGETAVQYTLAIEPDTTARFAAVRINDSFTGEIRICRRGEYHFVSRSRVSATDPIGDCHPDTGAATMLQAALAGLNSEIRP